MYLLSNPCNSIQIEKRTVLFTLDCRIDSNIYQQMSDVIYSALIIIESCRMFKNMNRKKEIVDKI